MTHTQFLQEIAEILETKQDSLSGAVRLDELGTWDSMAVISFIAMVDERAGATLSPRAVGSCRTIDDLYGLIPAEVGATL